MSDGSSKVPVVRLGELLVESCYGTNQPNSETGSTPVVGITHIRDGRVVLAEMSRVSLSATERRKLALRPGDILVTRTNSYDLVGQSGLVESETDAVFASYLVRLRVDASQVDPRYLNYWLNGPTGRRQVRRVSTRAVGQANVNPTELRRLVRIPLPPIAEQRRIARALSMWDSAIDNRHQQIDMRRSSWTAIAVGYSEMVGCGYHSVRLDDVASVETRQVDPRVTPYSGMRHLGPEDVVPGSGEFGVLRTAAELQLVSAKHLFAERSIVYSRIRPYLNKVCLPGFAGLCSTEMYPLAVDESVAVPEVSVPARGVRRD
jgi:hypothetical protein